MPDVGTPLTPLPTHTSTEAWQSFEMRMRHRRAERCLLRAEAALEAGFEEEARAALDEARQLDWQSPDFESLKARLELRRAAETTERTARRRHVYVAAAALAIFAAGGVVLVQNAREASPIATPTAPRPPIPVAGVASPPAPSLGAVVPAPDAALSPPQAQTAAIAAGEKPSSNTDQPRGDQRRLDQSVTERTLPSRADGKEGVVDPLRTSRGNTIVGAAAPPPPLAVPTTSSVPPETPLNSLGTVGSITGPPTPAPVAAARVPDLLPPPVTAPPAATPTPSPAPPDDSGVRAVLARYESAYSSLNASAAHSVWSGVDERSLERAFDSLDSQRVSLGRCSISMNGPRAQATCQGSTTWTPKVGGGTHSSARTWRFDLANAGGSWTITNVIAR